MALNKPFKNLVDAQYNQHFESNLDTWALGKISASDCWILMTQWIGATWERFCHEYKDAIRASFIKCGIALPIDGSQDTLINIHGLNNYSIPPWQSNPLLSLQHTAEAPPPESDSECYTEATNFGSEVKDDETDIDDGADTEDGVDTDIRVDLEVQDVMVPVAIGQGNSKVLMEAQAGVRVPPICLRRGLRSQITLGEEYYRRYGL